MKRITELTRRDIVDIIMGGFLVKEPETLDSDYEWETDAKGRYIVRIPFCGRLSEVEFLSRLYDLNNMPSYDRRFKNAYGDIIQHTVNNDDWDEYWMFSDDRFNLSKDGGDEPLLAFLCEMFHPVVRLEDYPWREYLKKFNQLLQPDGYELYESENISGREVYKYREINRIELPHTNTPIFAAKKPIGQGSYARTFRYTDPFYNKDFVVKKAKSELSEKELERFKREFEQMKALRSPYIVEVYSYFPETQEYTMELMDCTLYDYIIKNNTTLPLERRKSIIAQLLRGFRYLHSQSVLHRDVSACNALVNVYDDAIVVKISDFGLVKIVDSELTSENTEFKGSLNDPALRVQGFANYELRHELYAITLLCVYVLTGKTNFAKVREEPIVEFMHKGTDADINKRFQTLDELQKGISRCVKLLEKGC